MQMFKQLFASTAGQKALAAVSGTFMAGWLALHVLGNFTAFGGAPRMDAYAAALRRLGPVLWLVRAGLVAAFGVHVATTLSLAKRARAARPLHDVRRWPRGSVSSRTALACGPLLLAFATYHLLHMTFGVVHPHFQSARVYANLVQGLAAPAVAVLYALGAALVGLHLYRGLTSALSSLGSGSAARAVPRAVAAAVAVAIAAGFAVIPVAVMTGALR